MADSDDVERLHLLAASALQAHDHFGSLIRLISDLVPVFREAPTRDLLSWMQQMADPETGHEVAEAVLDSLAENLGSNPSVRERPLSRASVLRQFLETHAVEGMAAGDIAVALGWERQVTYSALAHLGSQGVAVNEGGLWRPTFQDPRPDGSRTPSDEAALEALSRLPEEFLVGDLARELGADNASSLSPRLVSLRLNGVIERVGPGRWRKLA